MTQNELFNEELIKRYDILAPRYTSYPTAPKFYSIDEQRYRDWVSLSNQNDGPKPLSLYLHIPFCSTVCYYCACTKVITANRQHAIPYLKDLLKEVEMQGRLFESTRSVEQIHWGGGTPTFLNQGQMDQLMSALRNHFRFCDDADGEYSIELDPREVDPDDVTFLRALGFNRLSLGVQDIDQRVQTAVNRIQPLEKTLEILQAANEHGFRSISLDLIYGLPLQTVDSFKATIDSVVRINPDRLSVFNYAHLPDRFKAQRQIKSSDLPSPAEKLRILKMTIETLCDAGYIYIGMDHFARPGDELATAQNSGSLHRNFQGYSTHGDCDLIGLGASSIGRINGNYAQNYHALKDYQESIKNKTLPINRGFELGFDDKLRRAIISELICHFRLDFPSIERRYQIRFNDYFSEELNALTAMAHDGLIDLQESEIKVRPPGRLLVRNICAVFD
nr:oxygen-independent coproporphyrinogen III oxidase [Arenicellales bacterium]